MLKPIDPKAIDQNVFSLIGEKWMLITAGTAERCNTMTASWGGLGVIWGAPSATCYIRPQRTPRNLWTGRSTSPWPSSGGVPGRPRPVRQQERPGEVDKVKECGFTVKAARCGAPYFEEAELVLVCRKRFVQPMDPARLPEDVKERCTPRRTTTPYILGRLWKPIRSKSIARMHSAPSRRTARLRAAQGERSEDAMNHLSQIADKLSQYDLDAMLIVSEPGERYAVGFQGEGYVLVTRRGAGIPPMDGTLRRPKSR